ncbi:hypothetical protein K456DRAFT_886614 [Colletotrichum gloeosporioides 23]|nr:hypothetical protein K456DRAFT_886614 [Colletotrichum gloeosporioides 23]
MKHHGQQTKPRRPKMSASMPISLFSKSVYTARGLLQQVPRPSYIEYEMPSEACCHDTSKSLSHPVNRPARRRFCHACVHEDPPP